MQITDVLLRPFVITDNTSISVSGGRTSGLMLHLVKLANGGIPANAVVQFANTGKEREETLVFVKRMQDEWQIDIKWVEYRDDKHKFAQVTFDTASRRGEPFAALIKKRNMTPNPLTRFCTQELKLRAMERWLKTNMEWQTWTSFVGIRADEPIRVNRLAKRCEAKTDPSRGLSPLATAGITKLDVIDFWLGVRELRAIQDRDYRNTLLRPQGFDLELNDYEGNCDFCMLKGRDKLLRGAFEKPDAVNWWIEADKIGNYHPTAGGFFGPNRMGGKGYAGLKRAVELEQAGVMTADQYLRNIAPNDFLEGGLFDLDCACTD